MASRRRTSTCFDRNDERDERGFRLSKMRSGGRLGVKCVNDVEGEAVSFIGSWALTRNPAILAFIA